MMKKHALSLLSLAILLLLVVTSGCSSVRISQQLTPQQTTQAQQLSNEIENTPVESAAAAQTSQSTDQPPVFSASEAYEQAVAAQTPAQEELQAKNTTPATKLNVQALREQIKEQKMSAPKKVILNAALKKLEKVQSKLEVKQAKASKNGKAIPDEYRLPFTIALIGLIVAIVFSIVYVWPLSVLGWLAFLGGGIWMLLIYLGEA